MENNINVRYPHVKVRLTGTNGNAFAVLGKVVNAMRKAHIPKEETDAFLEEAQSGDYDNLLQTVMAWVQTS